MGRMAGRQTEEDFFFKTREESTRFSGGCDTQIPNLPSPSSKWRSRGRPSRWRVREEREISGLSSTRKEQKCPSSLFSDLHKYIQQEEEGRRRWKRMRARALEKGRPTEGTSWGHWCLLECRVKWVCGNSLNVLYMSKIENILENYSVDSEHLRLATWTWCVCDSFFIHWSCPVAGFPITRNKKLFRPNDQS